MPLHLPELPPSYNYRMTDKEQVLSLTIIKDARVVDLIPVQQMSQEDLNKLSDVVWQEYFPPIITTRI